MNVMAAVTTTSTISPCCNTTCWWAATSPRGANGDVLFFGCGWNNMPVYRVTGWDQIKRQQGTVTVPASLRAAARKGTGLRAECFANGTLAGDAAARVDERIWFDDKHAWPQAAASVRWTGFIEPPLSGDYTFSFYTTDAGGAALDRRPQGARPVEHAREKLGRAGRTGGGAAVSREDRMAAKRRQARVSPELGGLDLPVEHVPTTALYPELTDGRQATMLPVPPAPPGTRPYDEVLDARGETETLDLRIPTPLTEGWQLSGIAQFAVAHADDTATFEILDTDGKPLVEWTAYRGGPRPGVTRDRGHANYLVFNGAEVDIDLRGFAGTESPFTLRRTEGKVRLELPNGLVVERPVASGDPARPATLRVTARAAQNTARVRIERICVATTGK